MVLEADSIIYEVDGRKILRGVFLNCRVGEIVGILGRNGSENPVCLKSFSALGKPKARLYALAIRCLQAKLSVRVWWHLCRSSNRFLST